MDGSNVAGIESEFRPLFRSMGSAGFANRKGQNQEFAGVATLLKQSRDPACVNQDGVLYLVVKMKILDYIFSAFDFTQALSAFVVLFALIDIFASIPIFLSIEEKGGKIRPFKVTLYATILFLVFLFLGNAILGLFRVDVSSFAVAGSIVLFIVSIEMVFGVRVFKHDEIPEGSASLVPVAFPLIAGPASFTALLSMRAEYHELNILSALFLNMIVVFFVLRHMQFVGKVVGKRGIYVLRNFFGIVLMTIAIKLFTSNIAYLVSKFGGT